LVAQTVLVSASPFGLPYRYDAIEDFRSSGLTHFLEENQEQYFRIYSFDRALMPNYAGLLGFFHLGAMSFTTQTFQDFAHSCLDSGAFLPSFMSNEYIRIESEPDPVTQLHNNVRFYSLLGVKYFVTSGTDLNAVPKGPSSDKTVNQGSKVASDVTFTVVYEDEHFKVFENSQAFPRVFLVYEYQVVPDRREALKVIRSSDFDLRHCVVLDSPLDSSFIQSSMEDGEQSATIVGYEMNRVSVLTKTSRSAILVLTDVYYPGWQAYVDGKSTRLFCADGIVRAVAVPPGQHKVIFSYEPRSFVIGSVLSLATILAVISFSIWRCRNSICYFLKRGKFGDEELRDVA